MRRDGAIDRAQIAQYFNWLRWLHAPAASVDSTKRDALALAVSAASVYFTNFTKFHEMQLIVSVAKLQFLEEK